MFFRLTPIVAVVIFFSCSKKSPEAQTKRSDLFQTFLANVPPLENGFTYRLEKQDAEECYFANEEGDSLFYKPPFPIIGKISNGNFHAFIHLEPGDDLFPVVRTFDNEGNQISEEVMAFGNCAGWDCDFDFCEEKFTIINQTTIENEIVLVTSPCNGDSEKDSTLTTKSIRKRTVTLGEKGQLIVVDEERPGGPEENNPTVENCDIKPNDVLLSTDHFVKYVLVNGKIKLTWGNESFTRSLPQVYDCDGLPVGIPTVRWNSDNYVGLGYGCGSPCWGTIILPLNSDDSVFTQMYNFEVDIKNNLVVCLSKDYDELEIINWKSGARQRIEFKVKCSAVFPGHCIDSLAFLKDQIYIKWNELDDQGDSKRKVAELVDIEVN